MNVITGEQLAEELQTLILQRKINTIAEKIDCYLTTIEQNTVDIPDFMKKKELQKAFFIEKSINRMLETGSIDYFYKLAIGEENGI